MKVWTCPKCGVEQHEQFDSCWNCLTDRVRSGAGNDKTRPKISSADRHRALSGWRKVSEPRKNRLRVFISLGREVGQIIRGYDYGTLPNTVEYIDEPWCEKPFSEYYRQNILPLLRDFEAQRLKAIRHVRNYTVPTVASIVFLTAWLGFISKENRNFAVFPVILLSLDFLYLWLVPLVKYKEGVRTAIYPLIFKFIGDFRYSMHGRLFYDVLRMAGLSQTERYDQIGDRVLGEYKGVALELHNATLSRGGGEGKEIVFKGVIARLSAHKKLKGKTVVLPNACFISELFIAQAIGLERVTLEDPRFEKHFDAYSTDQVEARYLLTPSFMERLLELDQKNSAGTIRASFFTDSLILMLPTHRNPFDKISVLHAATFINESRAILRDMEAILSVIDILQLDSQTRL